MNGIKNSFVPRLRFTKLLDTGIRSSELCGLRIINTDLKNRRIRVKVQADEDTAVPSAISVFPSANFDTFFLNTEIRPGDNAPAAAIGCPRQAACLIGYLDVTTEWDRRDNRLEAREGTYVALAVQGGLSQTAQLTPFARLLPEARG